MFRRYLLLSCLLGQFFIAVIRVGFAIKIVRHFFFYCKKLDAMLCVYVHFDTVTHFVKISLRNKILVAIVSTYAVDNL